MTFSPDTAGTMAEILAVLLLATAFSPDIRGALAQGSLDEPGDRGGAAITRYLAMLVTLAVIALDAVVVMMGRPAEGVWAQVVGFPNAIALGFLITSTVYAFHHHVRHKPRKASANEAGDDHP